MASMKTVNKIMWTTFDQNKDSIFLDIIRSNGDRENEYNFWRTAKNS
jgi:hypothetical protein